MRSLLFIVLGLSCARRPLMPGTAHAPDSLHLQTPPAMVARLDYVGPDREYGGPARLEVDPTDVPVRFKVEDYALAETIEIAITDDDPPSFAPVVGNSWTDSGIYVRDQDRIIMRFSRTFTEGGSATVQVLADLAPDAASPPKDWLAPGTTLYYGLTFDDKPITKLVPQGLNITIRENAAHRVLDWIADVDPNTQTDLTRELFRRGSLIIPASVAERASVHHDEWREGEVEVSATAFFVPRSTRKNLTVYGGAAWEDRALGPLGVLEAHGQHTVVLQADDALWGISATIATAHQGRGVYVIADDPDDPLILSAVRPGVRIKLMAIGRPKPAD